MAADLAEVWGEEIARPQSVECEQCSTEGSPHGKRAKGVVSARVASTGPPTLEQALLYEIGELRREHAQRSSIMLAILLFIAATLFLHMDRTHAYMRNLR